MRQNENQKMNKHEKAPGEDHIRNRIDRLFLNHMHTYLNAVLLSSNVHNVSVIRIIISDPDNYRVAMENYSLKGSFTIIDIYESVHSVRFLMTPLPQHAPSTPRIHRFTFMCK